MIPIHVLEHFMLLLVHFDTGVIDVLDSWQQDDLSLRLTILSTGVQETLQEALGIEGITTARLHFRLWGKDVVPQQPDCDSCGAYLAYFMIATLQGRTVWTFGPSPPDFAEALREFMVVFNHHYNTP